MDVHYSLQISTGSISLSASVALVSMIYLTPKCLSTPYRRLIFGMSVFDIMQSLGILTGPFAVPSGSSNAPWAIGTTASCELNGFISLLGSVAVPIYTFALSVRFFCKLNLRMDDEVFTKKIEKWFHLSILLVVILCFVALVMDTFNPLPSGSFCYVEEYPFFCRDHPEWVGECQRGNGSETLAYVVTGITCVCFLGIIVNLSMLCIQSIYIERIYRSRAGDLHHSADYSCVRRFFCFIPCRNYQQLDHEPDADYVLRLYKMETFIQSILYVGSFFLCYVCPMMQTIGSFFNYQFPTPFPYFISILYPLGGFFNVLTYTRPKVVRLRHAFPDFSRLRAFYIVMRAGGELPDLVANPYALQICHGCKKKRKRTNDIEDGEITPPEYSGNNIFEMMASLSD